MHHHVTSVTCDGRQSQRIELGPCDDRPAERTRCRYGVLAKINHEWKEGSLGVVI